MKTRIFTLLVSLGIAVSMTLGGTSSVSAGSNNGTHNWYWKQSCSAGGQTMTVSNYDMGYYDQEYHAGMTTSGSVFGYQPTALYIGSVKITSYLKDNFNYFTGQSKYTVKAVWSKPTGSVSCSVYG